MGCLLTFRLLSNNVGLALLVETVTHAIMAGGARLTHSRHSSVNLIAPCCYVKVRLRGGRHMEHACYQTTVLRFIEVET